VKNIEIDHAQLI